ncbi:MAG: hypothetical protein KDD69_13740 [Bdellovibrionales bacterium]|nr:hypothetical protein [Bdellovibrionales bacterium]
MPSLKCDSISDEAGATLVEATIVYPILLLSVIASLELIRCTYIALAVQFSVTTVLRDAVIGPAVFAAPPYNGAPPLYENFIRQRLQELTSGFRAPVAPEDIQISCLPPSHCREGAGQPGVLVQVQVLRPTRILFFHELRIRSIAVARNERWDSL